MGHGRLIPEQFQSPVGHAHSNLWGTMLLQIPCSLAQATEYLVSVCCHEGTPLGLGCGEAMYWKSHLQTSGPFSLTSSYPVVVAESRLKKHYFYANTLDASHNPVFYTLTPEPEQHSKEERNIFRRNPVK